MTDKILLIAGAKERKEEPPNKREDVSSEMSGKSVEQTVEKTEPSFDEQQNYVGELEVEKLVDDLVELINSSESTMRIFKCRMRPTRKNMSFVQVTVPSSWRFYKPGDLVLVYANKELPFFVGISMKAFPELAEFFNKFSVREYQRIVKDYLNSSGRTALIVWMLKLLEKDEKFRLLIELLNKLSEEIHRCEVKKEKIRAMKKLLDGLSMKKLLEGL